MQQVAVPQPPFDMIKTATDSLVLPLRRPVLFVPFAFSALMTIALIMVVFIGTFTITRHPHLSSPQYIAVLGTVVLVIITQMLALEVTTDLTARAELGQEVDLADAVTHAVSRFPTTLGAIAVYVLCFIVGLMLLIVPGVIIGTRWMLAMTAVLIGRKGVSDAIRTSWQMTGAHFFPLFGLLLLLTVAAFVLSLLLSLVPLAGPLAAAWLGFGWAAIALTLAYIRLGGPVDLS